MRKLKNPSFKPASDHTDVPLQAADGLCKISSSASEWNSS